MVLQPYGRNRISNLLLLFNSTPCFTIKLHLYNLVDKEGLEPTTYPLWADGSNQLSYMSLEFSVRFPRNFIEICYSTYRYTEIKVLTKHGRILYVIPQRSILSSKYNRIFIWIYYRLLLLLHLTTWLFCQSPKRSEHTEAILILPLAF